MINNDDNFKMLWEYIHRLGDKIDELEKRLNKIDPKKTVKDILTDNTKG